MKHTLGLSFLVAVAACLPARGAELDFGDRSSATLTTKAWKALEGKEYADAIAYAKKCVELYKDKAVEMQKELKEPAPTDDDKAASKKRALNDAGTCLFITGQALEKQDKGADAIKSYAEQTRQLPRLCCRARR